jgi:2-methylaconitate cis-trans-isomerase PrpF
MTAQSRPKAVPFVLMRGGTSKGVIFRQEDLPVSDRGLLAEILLDLFGSPDVRQIDGLGGADPLTSKAAIIGPPTRPGTDVRYLHGQVSLTDPEVDFKLSCGNLTAAVAAYAVTERFVKPVEGSTRVNIHSVVTDSVIHADVPVRNGLVTESGDFAIAGVPGTGARISLDFADAVGTATGTLLPTGRACDRVAVAGIGDIDVSIVDLGNLVVFVSADQKGGRSSCWDR